MNYLLDTIAQIGLDLAPYPYFPDFYDNGIGSYLCCGVCCCGIFTTIIVIIIIIVLLAKKKK